MSSDWPIVKWGELVELRYGKSLKNYKDGYGNIPVYGTNGPIGFTEKALCDYPSVIVGRKGAYRGIHFSDKAFFVIDTAFYIKPKAGINLKWAYYQLLTQDINGMDSGSAIPSTSREDFYQLETELPPVEEQERIVNILDSLNNKIELNRQTNQTLEHIAQAIFKSWFVDFEPTRAKIAARQAYHNLTSAEKAGVSEQHYIERAAICAISGKTSEQLDQLNAETQQQLKTTAALFPDALVESELGEMPEGWGVGIIGDMFELHRGFDLPKNNRKDGLYPVYAAGGYHGQHAEFKMEPPGIITGRSGVIGNVYLSLSKYWPLNTTLYVRKFKRCGPYYAYFFLNMCDLKSLNSGSAVPSLNRNFVHSMNALLPDDRLLDIFENITKSSFVKIKSNDSEINLLSSLCDLLLPKLLSSEVTIGTSESTIEDVKQWQRSG